MTGNQINSFVGNLVEMAKAYEELPGVREALNKAHEQNDRAQAAIASREEHIIRLKAELAEAHANTRRVEAERDEAIGSFLAADDRADKILAFVKATFGSAGALIQAVEPPPVAKAEPEQTPKAQEDIQPIFGDPLAEAPLHSASQGESASGEPFAVTAMDQPSAASDTSPVDAIPTSTSPAPEVAPTPTPAPAPPAPIGTGTESGTFGFESEPDASRPALDPPLPYLGRRYVDVPGYVSIDDWIAGGGTEYNYYLRP